MPLQILDPQLDDFDQVRALLDVSFTPDDVPDSIIRLDVYAGRAEGLVLIADPIALTRPAPDSQLIRMAAIFLTASLIAPVLPAIIHERFGTYLYNQKPQDMEALAASLAGQAYGIIGDVISGHALDSTYYRTPQFTTVHSARTLIFPPLSLRPLL